MMQKILILMSGFQACGKTTTAKIISENLKIEIVSNHEIRAKYPSKNEVYSNEYQELIYEKAFELTLEKLFNDKSVIMDGMFHLRKFREKAYSIAYNNNAKIIVVECICPNINVIKTRTKERLTSRGVPEDEGNRMIYYEIRKAEAEPIDLDITKNGEIPPRIVFNTEVNTLSTNVLYDLEVNSIISCIDKHYRKHFGN